jgi:hypothetical protein
MKRLFTPFLALSLLLAAVPAQAEFSTPSETLVISVEESTASGALHLAQRQALSRIIEAYLRSKSPVPLRNPQLILDELGPKALSFFESQQFLEQKSNQLNSATVKIQFKLKTKELTQAVDKVLAGLETAKNRYRIAVLVSESLNGQEQGESSLRLELENALLKQGYAVLDSEYSEKMLSSKRQALGQLLNNPEKAAELAQEQGADIVLVVNNAVKQERNAQNQPQLSAHVVLRAILAATGQKRLNLEEYFVVQGPTLERMLTEVGKNAGAELGARLSDDLLALAAKEVKNQALSAASGATQSMQLVLNGLKTYRRQALPLIKVLQEIPSIKTVELRSQGGEQASFYLTFEGSQADLENKLWNKLDGIDALARLDREAAAENTVYLTFKPPANVVLAGITDYRKQALPFIRFLKTVAQVKEVETHSFGGSELVLHVYYNGLSSDLERGIWEKLEAEKDFPALYRDPSGAGEIKFSLFNGPLLKSK